MILVNLTEIKEQCESRCDILNVLAEIKQRSDEVEAYVNALTGDFGQKGEKAG